MRALLWKEFREKRYWVLALAAAAVTPVLIKDGYTFAGSLIAMAIKPWNALPLGVALLFGLGAYSSELAGSNADFLHSRPVSWKRVLLAKLITSAAMMLTAGIISAVVYRLTCPGPYAAFATPLRLAEGVGYSTAIMALGYIIGAACSIALPGTIGGLVTLIAIALIATLAQMGLITISSFAKSWPFWSIAAWPIAAILATILIARFGITLTTGARAGRYAILLLILALPISALDLAPIPKPQYSAIYYLPGLRMINVSPDGKYALAMVYAPPERVNEQREQYGQCGPVTPINESCIIRLSDGKKAPLDWEPELATWALDDTACILKRYSWRYASMHIVKMERDGRLTRKSIRLPYKGISSILQPSPDGQIIMITNFEQTGKETSKSWLIFVDVTRGKLLSTKADITHGGGIHWLSNTEVEYIRYLHPAAKPAARRMKFITLKVDRR